ncbi:MAG: thiol reductant ABC exporter subunit CydD [Chloroflexi bacterium]|nr:thiol reductant ABC exporter subunit CydD [Chloroflexota bacterium]
MNDNMRLIRQARSTGLVFPLTVLFGFLSGGMVVLQSWVLSGVVNAVFLEKATLMEVVPLLRLILFLILGRVVFTVANETLAGVLAVKVKTHLRELLIDKIDQLGPAFLKNERTGELATTALQGIDALDVYFSQFLPQILLAVLLPVVILVVVFPVDLLTGIILMITAPLIPLFMFLIGKVSESLTSQQWSALSRLGAFFLDTLQGLSTLMTLGRSKDRAEEIKQTSERYREMTLGVLRITFLSAFVLELVASISTAVVAVEIGLRLIYARILFEQAFFILLIAPEFYLPMRNLSVRYHAGLKGLTAAGRIFRLLDLPLPKRNLRSEPLRKTNPLQQTFSLVMKDIYYQYSGNSIPTLKGFNFSLESGKHYALVGESGAGKSTIAQLLLRFISPGSGSIQVNGMDIEMWTPQEWRKSISWVGQKPMIFNTTLLENVRLKDPNISIDSVMEALEKVSLGKFLANLPRGLDTPVEEGGYRLSGGEAQRVAIARAILKNSPFIVMDEPTAHMNQELEQVFQKTSRDLFRQKTTFIIAHRLSTVQAVDGILVLKQGRLVEYGTHDELLTLAGEYARLVDAAEVPW